MRTVVMSPPPRVHEQRRRVDHEKRAVCRYDVRSARNPRPPLRLQQRVHEPFRMVQVEHEQPGRDRQQDYRGDDRRQLHVAPQIVSEESERRDHHDQSRRDRFRPRVRRDDPVPWRAMRVVVREDGRRVAGCRVVGACGRRPAGSYLCVDWLRLAEVALERCRGRVERRTRCVDVEELWIGVLLGPAYLDLLPSDEVRDVRHGVFEVPNKNRLRRADRYAGGLESSVDPIRTEVTLLSAVRHRIDVDGVVWTRRHTCLTADTARAVEVHYAVRALEHGRRGAYLHARRVGALVAAGDLEVPANVRVSPDLDLLDVRAIDAQRNVVFLLARDGAGMTADALAVVDDLPCPR